MSGTNRDENTPPPCAEVRSGSRVRVALSPDTDHTMVSFDDSSDESVTVLIARDVLPRLVEMIQFAGLADAPAPRRMRRRVSPSEGALPGLVTRKAPGDGDGA